MGATFTKCVYCEAPAPLSAEHVVPDALGGSWVLYCVCKRCNSRLGHQVDVGLSENFLARLARQALYISGKGPIPNVFETGVIKVPGGGEHRAYYHMKRDGSPDRVEVAMRVSKNDLGDGRVHVQGVADATASGDLFAALNKTLARRGDAPITREQFDENAQRTSVQTPEMTIDLEMDVDGYVPGLVKIAYEAAAYWLGETYVETDPIAALLRAGTFDLDALIGHRGNADIGFRMDGEPDVPADQHLHTIMLIRYEQMAIAVVAIFGNTFMCNWVATEDPDKYGFTTSRMIEMDATKRTFVESDVPPAILREYLGTESVR